MSTGTVGSRRNLGAAKTLALVGLGGLCVAASGAELAQSEPITSALHTFRVVTVVDGLVNPWSMAWLPNGDMLVTERPGRLRIVRNGELLPDAVPGVPAVRVVGQGGLQDVVVHPDFATNRLIYLSFAKPNADGSQGTTAIVRGRLEHDALVDVEEIFEAQPYSASPGHYGARMAFDGQGHLFVSSGERMAPSTGDLTQHPAQITAHDHGKILRLNDDGSVPADNPFVGREGFAPEIWSYGHRNPQGLAFDRETGILWETEHGPQGGDELNQIRPGLNYGWPVITYGMNYRVGTPIGHREQEGMEQPAAFWVPSIATSGLMIYHGDKFPMWKGNAFVGGLSAQYQQLSRVMLDGTTVTNREPLLQNKMRIRDVREGPDGYIYIATDNSLGNPTPIVRLEPAD
ncbi:MAG TPA: PQQ-dependent sugar dehydrogenase [Gammaproteobacteria bacterium]